MSTLVSILIPAFNAGRWVTDTIEMALSQTWANKEIIIVDDGSTDNTLTISKGYESRLLKVISQDNKGVVLQGIKPFNSHKETIFNGWMQMIY